MKRCSKCKVEKQETEFPKAAKEKDGLSYSCKECTNAAFAQWRKDNPEKYKAGRAKYDANPEIRARRAERMHRRYLDPQVRELLRARKDKIHLKLTQLVIQIKLERGCYDCGYCLDPRVLQFDHVRGKKTKAVAWFVHALHEKGLIEELGKCEVRCAMCHLIKTDERRKARIQ